MKTKRTIDLGYYSINKECDNKKIHATIDLEYKENNNGKMVFRCSGNFGDSGGQCLDTMAKYIDTPLFNTIYRLWCLYHMNHMNPDCIHQRHDPKFQQSLNEKIIVYQWLYLKEELYSEKKKG